MGFCTFLVPVRYLCLKCEILWLIPNGNLVVEKGNRIYQKNATFSFWPFTILFLSILYCKLWYTSLWFTLPIETKSSPV